MTRLEKNIPVFTSFRISSEHPLIDKDPFPFRMLHILRLHRGLPEEEVG